METGPSSQVTPSSSRSGSPLAAPPSGSEVARPCSEDGWRPTFWNKAGSPQHPRGPPLPRSSGKRNLWERSCWVIDFSVNMMSEKKGRGNYQ